MLTALALACALSSTECRSLDAARITDAIDAVTDDDGLRAILVVYSYHESHWQTRPRAWSWDARAGKARGPWQLWTGGDEPVESQARTWLGNVQASSLASVDSSPSRAWRRAREAQALVESAR